LDSPDGVERTTADLIVLVEGQRYSIPLGTVSRVVRAVEITPVVTAPGVFAGVIDVGGDIVPVVDLRLRLRLEGRPIAITDCMVIARTSRAVIVLPVDAVIGISERLFAPADDDCEPLGADCLSRALRDAEGIVLELAIDRVVTQEELSGLFEVASLGGPT